MKAFFASGLLFISLVTASLAATTINANNKFAFGANLGWMDCRGDTNNGAVIGEYVCSGFIYSANVGWVNLGSGSPANQIQYQNLSTNDFGVNQDGFGNLRGYAYGANIGWISFENTGAPTVDLKSGRLSGYAYSANCGWISLSNAYAYVQTGSIAPGALDANGLPIAWELLNFGHTGVDPNADPDGDGMSNRQEYLAGTDPNKTVDLLAITWFGAAQGGTQVSVTWDSTTTRCYYIEESLSINSPLWFDGGLGLISPDGSSTTRSFGDTNAPVRFYRVRAVRPLAP